MKPGSSVPVGKTSTSTLGNQPKSKRHWGCDLYRFFLTGGNIATVDDIFKNVIKPRAVGVDLNNIVCEVQWDAERNVVTVKIQYIWTPEAFFAPQKLSCTAIALATY